MITSLKKLSADVPQGILCSGSSNSLSQEQRTEASRRDGWIYMYNQQQTAELRLNLGLFIGRCVLSLKKPALNGPSGVVWLLIMRK